MILQDILMRNIVTLALIDFQSALFPGETGSNAKTSPFSYAGRYSSRALQPFGTPLREPALGGVAWPEAGVA